MSRFRGLISPLLIMVATATAAPALAATSPGTSGDAAVESAATAVLQATPATYSATPLGFYWQLTTPQAVSPGTFLLAVEDAVRHHRHASEGTRSDQQFFQISSTGSNDVPDAALAAYKHAADTLAKEQPGCQIPWTLLAAIGRVESNHGRFGGAQLGSDGVSRPEILGPRLNGAGAFAAIHDTDHGVLDHDKVWDRAVGQMQFLPGTWASVGRDGDGDGKANPDDINDSALAAAVYLCGAGGSLATPAGVARAAFRYNHSDYYVQLVMSFQAGYETGVFAVPTPPPPPPARHHRHVRTRSTATKHVTTHTTTTSTHAPSPTPTPVKSKPTSGSSPTPTPTPTPTPGTPSPSPTPPALPSVVEVTGTLRAVADGYTLDGVLLDLGIGRMNDTAKADYDGDGTLETNRQELDGLVAGTAQVKIHGSRLADVITVDKIDDLDY